MEFIGCAVSKVEKAVMRIIIGIIFFILEPFVQI